MPKCPKCGTALRDDYGMVTCPTCNTIVFVDMEGVAHIGEESSDSQGHDEVPSFAAPIIAERESSSFTLPISAPLGSDSGSNIPSENESSQAPFSFEPPMEVDLDFSAGGSDNLPEALGGNESSTDAGVWVPRDDVPSEFVSPSFVTHDSNELSGEYSGEHSDGSFEAVPTEPKLGPADDPLGLNEFANSEISQAKDGLLLFRIFISGIDSKEMRQSLREAIGDRRFAWNPDELVARVSKGSLVIDQLSPVKASVLINRMKRLPLKIRWEQYAITQMDGEENV